MYFLSKLRNEHWEILLPKHHLSKKGAKLCFYHLYRFFQDYVRAQQVSPLAALCYRKCLLSTSIKKPDSYSDINIQIK